MAAMAVKKHSGKLSVLESKLEDDKNGPHAMAAMAVKKPSGKKLSVRESELEDDNNTADFRAELEGTPYKDLQAMAKESGVPANLKTSMLIDGIVYSDMEVNGSDLSTRTYDCVTYMQSMEAVRLLMKKSGANCILDCARRVKAELFLALTAVEPGVTDGKPAGIESKANKVVPPQPQLSALAAVKPGVGEPAVVKAKGNANGKIEKANEVVPPPNLPLAVSAPLASAVQYAPIYVVGFSDAMKDVDLQNLFDTKAIVGRFHKKRFGKVACFAKVLLPIDKVDRVLSQDFSFSGSKLRVAKWREPSLSAPPVHQAASSAKKTRRSGRRTRSRRIPSADTASLSNGLIKEQASFIAQFLAPQPRPQSGGPHSHHGERLYSQIVAAVKTVDVRTKFLERTMREMTRLLQRL